MTTKIAVFGGRTGAQAVERVLSREYEVAAFVRSAETLPFDDSGLDVVAGEPTTAVLFQRPSREWMLELVR